MVSLQGHVPVLAAGKPWGAGGRESHGRDRELWWPWHKEHDGGWRVEVGCQGVDGICESLLQGTRSIILWCRGWSNYPGRGSGRKCPPA